MDTHTYLDFCQPFAVATDDKFLRIYIDNLGELIFCDPWISVLVSTIGPWTGSAEINFLQLKALVNADGLSEIGLLKGLR